MIKLEKTKTYCWDAAIRGMRNPMNSWEKSDTIFCGDYAAEIGTNDRGLMMKLANGGPVHAKYRRMLIVTVDITAPLYWWKEFDTYKVGTVSNSCSTMHKVHSKEFTLDDFSHEHLNPWGVSMLERIIAFLNDNRDKFNDSKDKDHWWQMIQMLPTSYNQKRTVMLNYEVLVGMYHDRKNHKLDEWHDLCDWICSLPCSEVITNE